MTPNLAVAHVQIVIKDEPRDDESEQGMIEAIEDPGEERMHAEEGTFLAKLIELRVAVKEAGRNELVKDAHC